MVAQTEAASSPPAPWSGAGRIAGPDDVARVLAAVNAGGARRANTAALRRPVAAVDDLAERSGGAAGHLPVHLLLAPLLSLNEMAGFGSRQAGVRTVCRRALICRCARIRSWRFRAADGGRIGAATGSGPCNNVADYRWRKGVREAGR